MHAEGRCGFSGEAAEEERAEKLVAACVEEALRMLILF